MIELTGITWDHPRGHDPLLATAAEFARRRSDVHINWERRSLQAFGDASVEQLAEKFDLLVIDHPHVGDIAASASVLPFDGCGRDRELAELAKRSIARSHQSYEYNGRLWALAIDAAAQVSAFRPDLLDRPPTSWKEVSALADRGAVIWPLKPVDSLMSFFSLCCNFGSPCADAPGELIKPADGIRVLEFMRSLAGRLAPECLSLSPPQALDRMSQTDQYHYCPLLFGYTTYSRAGFRPRHVRFTDIPRASNGQPEGAILGGTGLAISAKCKAVDAAIDYAFWIAGGECQRTLYFQSGGQPAHADAWEDPAANQSCDNFFRNTRATLDHAWIRPRFEGYIDFQIGGGDLVHECLTGKSSPRETIEAMQSLIDRCAQKSNKMQ